MICLKGYIIDKEIIFRKNKIYKNLIFLFFTVFAGFAVIITVHITINDTIKKLDKQIQNETTRYRLGELVIHKVNDIEYNFYKMTTALNYKTAQQDILNSIKEDISTINKTLNILEKGGVLKYAQKLKGAENESLDEVYEYTPNEQKQFTLEKIRFQLHLTEIMMYTNALQDILYAENTALERNDLLAVNSLIIGMQNFFNTVSPVFNEMTNTATKMLFESKLELIKIQTEAQNKQNGYISIESTVIIVDLFLVFILGLLSAKQIRKVAQKLEEAKVEYELMADEAKVASDFKSEFLANMSHEIRTPLNAMLGFIDILAEKIPNTEYQKYIEIIKKSGRSLLGIINDVLDISKIESGKLEIDNIDFFIKDELQEVFALFFEKAKEKSLNFNITIKDNMPDVIKSDPMRIRQITSNLLSNAIKFTNIGGSVSVLAYFNETENKICVDVSDTGIGVSQEHINNLFKSFSQEDSSITRKYGGTGLGLAISSKLCVMMGGELGVKSTKGLGSKFYFTIPYIKGDELKAKESHSTIAKRHTGQTFSGSILVVEDVKANQQLMKIILEKLGLKVDLASDGVEGVEKCMSGNYDLVFMDENMPNLNGREAAKRILELRAKRNLPKIPIIALTANALSGDREKFLQAGMDDYLTKPINKNTIIQTLSIFLKDS